MDFTSHWTVTSRLSAILYNVYIQYIGNMNKSEPQKTNILKNSLHFKKSTQCDPVSKR